MKQIINWEKESQGEEKNKYRRGQTGGYNSPSLLIHSLVLGVELSFENDQIKRPLVLKIHRIMRHTGRFRWYILTVYRFRYIK
jgi:hypothetical protein